MTHHKSDLCNHISPYCNIHLPHYPHVSWACSVALLHVAMGLYNTCMYPGEWRPLGACVGFKYIRTSSLGSAAGPGQTPISLQNSSESYRGGIQDVSLERLWWGGCSVHQFLQLVYTHKFLLKKFPDRWEVLFNKLITLWRCQCVHKGGRKKIEADTHLLTQKAAE